MTTARAFETRPRSAWAGEPESEGKSINVGEAERLASKIGGGVLLAAGLSRGGLGGLTLAGLGGVLFYRGMTGHCDLYEAIGANTAEDEAGTPPHAPVRADENITINRTPEDLYRSWRDHETLSRFLPEVFAVTSTDGVHSHWAMEGPLGWTLEWDSEVVNDEPGRLISWQSTGGDIQTAGTVRFAPAMGDRGTEVRLEQMFNPPLGAVGAGISKLMGMSPSGLSRQTLRRFKQLMEAGEVATIEGQPQGPR